MEEKRDGYSFADEEGKRAAKKAMEWIAYKDRTKKELEDKLYRAGFSEKASKQAMDYVMSFGYIDDRRYVENYRGGYNRISLKEAKKKFILNYSRKAFPRS